MKTPIAPDMRGRIAPIVLVWFTLFSLFYQRSVITVAIPQLMKSIHIGAAAAGALVSFQLAGYALLPPVGGYFADRIGPRRMMVITLISGSVFSLISGFMSTFGGLAASRFMFGASQGADIPSYNKVNATWYPDRRGFASGLTSTAGNVGQAVALLISGLVITQFGILTSFWVAAIPGVVVAVFVLFYLKDRPAHMKEAQKMDVVQQTTLRDLLKSRTAWLLCIVYLLFNVGFWGYVAWMPTYLVQARHFSIVHSGLYSSLGFFAGVIGIFLLGVLGDLIGSRKWVIAGSYVFGALALFVAFYSGSAIVSVAALTVVGFFLLGSLAPLYAFVMDVASPEVVGKAFGIFQFFGIAGGFCAPIVIGLMVSATNSFGAGFWFMIIALLVSAAVMGSAMRRESPTIGPTIAKA